MACVLEGERRAHVITLRYTRNVFIHRAVIGGAPAARVHGTDTRIAVCGGERLDSWGHGMGAAASATATAGKQSAVYLMVYYTRSLHSSLHPSVLLSADLTSPLFYFSRR